MGITLNIDKSELISRIAAELKGSSNVQPPEWAQFVKTGAGRDRTPAGNGWWFTRAASVLVAVADMGPIGVSKLRVKYGNKKNRGVKPEKFYKSSGNIIRKILQQLEADALIKKADIGIHKGRIITKEGMEIINRVLPKGQKIEASKEEAKAEVPAKKELKQREKKKEHAKEKKGEKPAEKKEGPAKPEETEAKAEPAKPEEKKE